MDTTRVRAEIDLNAIRYNMESMHNNLKEGTGMIAVIKTNGYGHGASEIAKVLEPMPYVWGYAVATADEGKKLREDGLKKPILILGISFPAQYEEMIREEMRPAVASYAAAKQLSEAAERLGRTVAIHIKIDTGMSRIGFLADRESVEEIEKIAKLPNLKIEGIFTHFARADETVKDSAMEQIRLFVNMIEQIESKGIRIPLHHCSNSAGIIEIPEANMDLVRAGITLYGLWPSDEVQKNVVDLKPVMSIKSHISFLKRLPAGKSISYGGTYTAATDRIIATIPVGYGDGYCRGLSNKGYVLIHGQKAPICGRVCLDQYMVAVTDTAGVRENDEVTLLGKDGDAVITMEELGDLSGRFNYEFACLITDRVPRVYCNSIL